MDRKSQQDLADTILAHVVSLIDSPDGLEPWLDEDGEVPIEIRAQIGRWIARMPITQWDTRLGPRPDKLRSR